MEKIITWMIIPVIALALLLVLTMTVSAEDFGAIMAGILMFSFIAFIVKVIREN